MCTEKINYKSKVVYSSTVQYNDVTNKLTVDNNCQLFIY